MTSIIIADDHAIVREGLVGLMRLDPSFVLLAQTDDAESTLEAVNLHRPNVLLLDLIMPGMGDTAALTIARLIETSPETHIVILTSNDDDQLTLSVLEAGAHSYLLKSMRGEQLLAAIHDAAKGIPTLHPLVARRVLGAIRKKKTVLFEELTARELEVLYALAEGRSNSKIASNLNITEKTVKAHLGSIMSKLYVKDRTEAVALAWRSGFMNSVKIK